MDKAQEFNAAHPVGTPVRYWHPQLRTGEGVQSRTRTPAWLPGHGEPVVSVEGYTGGIYLTHVEVLGEASLSTARDYLAAVQQRADDPRAKYHHKPCSAPVCGSRHCQTARDRDRLLALALSVVDLADGIEDRDDLYAEQEHPNETVVINAAPVHELRAAITDALTPKEDDS